MGVRGGSWGVWGRSRGILGALGVSQGFLECLGVVLGRLGLVLGGLGIVLGELGAVLGRVGREDEEDASLMMSDRGLIMKIYKSLGKPMEIYTISCGSLMEILLKTNGNHWKS